MKTCDDITFIFRKCLLLLPHLLILILSSNQASGHDGVNLSVRYRLTDLGTTGDYSAALSINEAGIVVGQVRSGHSYSSSSAFAWQSGKGTKLETAKGTFSYAFAINAKGQATGYIAGKETDQACLWDQGQRIDLTTPTSTYSQAYALNNAGAVVGVADLNGFYGHAFLWQNGKMTDLGVLNGGHSCAYGINDKNEVVGYALTAFMGTDMACKAFLWRDGKMTDLGINGVAYAINNHSQIIGVEGSYGFLWQEGKAVRLGSLGGSECYAYGLNDSGEIVGASGTKKEALHACVWRNGRIEDLNSEVSAPGWTLIEARSINAGGQIVGVGKFRGQRRAFLLTPTQPSAPLPPPKASEPANEVIDTTRYPLPPNLVKAPFEYENRRVIPPVEAVLSAPVVHGDVEFRTVVQSVWPLPQKNEKGDLASPAGSEGLYQPRLLPHDGQSNLCLGIRLTNRSKQPLYFQCDDSFIPYLIPMQGSIPLNGRDAEISGGFTVPPNIYGLGVSPQIAPGQSFTLTCTARLAWSGDSLVLDCFNYPGLSRARRLKAGKYQFYFVYYNHRTKFDGDLLYDGEIEAKKVVIEIR
jgi:probable HAF family extracellular repeat protein